MLCEAYEQATSPYEREHVTPYLKTNPAATSRVVLRDEVYAGGDFSNFRITLDTPEDYTVIRTLIEQYGANKLAHPELLALLVAHPEVMALNAHIEQKTA
jgi:spore coat polysaccharide biosynthesis protein SpsF